MPRTFAAKRIYILKPVQVDDEIAVVWKPIDGGEAEIKARAAGAHRNQFTPVLLLSRARPAPLRLTRA